MKRGKMRSMKYLGNYIKGKFAFSSHEKNFFDKAHISPADFKDQIFTQPKALSAPVDLACETGKNAYLPWTKLSIKARVEKLFPLKQIIKKNLAVLSQTVSRETGKPLWESESEVKALIAKIDFVLKEGLDRRRTQIVPKAEGRIRFKSRGLFIVIGPFNFPLHLPLGQILPALLAGNTVIFKPSEKSPASGQKLAEMFHKLKLPPGVFQMIQGGKGLSQKLCRHSLGDGVLFTGSFQAGQKIKESLVKDHSKILALEMGGYNSALIWDSSEMDRALSETLKGCFWTAGQRCSSTSQIILNKKISSEFIKKFIPLAQKTTVDHWSKNPFMGCVIDKFAVQRFFSFQKEIRRLGGKTLLEGKKTQDKNGHYISPGVYKMKFNPSSSFGTKETFTPQVVIYETTHLEEALKMINHSGYGLSLSVFSGNKKVCDEIFYQAKVGIINYALSSVGASGYLPFGGLGKSGNDRPAGAFAMDFCVTPLAERIKGGF